MRLVTPAKVMPRCPWPKAWIRFGWRRLGPMTGSELGSDGRKPSHCDLNGPEIREKLADASLEKGNSLRIERRGETAKLDRSRDPQTAVHRRDIEAEIDRADGPLDRTGIHREFDMVAALRIEGDVVAALLGQRARPGAGGENDRMRIDSEIATDRAGFVRCPGAPIARRERVETKRRSLPLRPPAAGSTRRDRRYGQRPEKRRRRPPRGSAGSSFATSAESTMSCRTPSSSRRRAPHSLFFGGIFSR